MTRIQLEPDLPGVGPVALEEIPTVAYHAVLTPTAHALLDEPRAVEARRGVNAGVADRNVIVFKVSYPRAERARSRLRHEVRSGEIVKPERCQQCGAKAQLHGHHHDYTKPFDVEWLCSRCHASRHAPGALALSRRSPDI